MKVYNDIGASGHEFGYSNSGHLSNINGTRFDKYYDPSFGKLLKNNDAVVINTKKK